MAQPATLEDSLRLHDEAFYNWLGGLRVDYPADPGGLWMQRLNEPIIRVNAPPSRAFASVLDQLVSSGWFASEASAATMRTKAAMMATLPLPVATWTRADPVPDPEMAGASKRMYTRTIDPLTGLTTPHRWPAHYRTDYSVNFWCHKRYTSAFIKEWVMGTMGSQPGASQNEYYLTVNHKAPWGPKIQKLGFTSSSDQSTIEGTEPLYQRFNFVFTLRTWIMRPALEGSAQVTGVSMDGEPVHETTNLFTVATVNSLAVTGNASASLGPVPYDFGFKVTTGSDTVSLGAYRAELSGGAAVFSFYYDYVADESFTLAVQGQDANGSSPRPVLSIDNSASPIYLHPRHLFFVVTQPQLSLSIKGAGVPATAALSKTTLKQLSDETRTSPGAVTSNTAMFASLIPGNYLVCATFSAAAIGIVAADDDMTSPNESREQIVDGLWSVALLVTTKTDSLKFRWPSTVSIASVWAQRYYGTYHGNQ